jgi:hypothetical protein
LAGLPGWAQIQPAPADAPQAEEVVRKSVELARLNFDRGKDYTFIQRVEQRQMHKDGRVKKKEAATFDVIILEGTQYQKKVAVDDKPLTGKKMQESEKAFEKELAKRRDESDKQRRKRLEKEAEEREELRALVAEIPHAFYLTMAGSEIIDGVRTWVIDARPRAEYQPRVKRADLLPKFEGRLWIDEDEFQWVKVEAKTIAPVNFGWVLARVYPGSVMTFRQSRINNEVWLPAAASMRLDAKLAMVMRVKGEIDVSWKEYRKFQSDSRIVSAEEVTEKD